MSNTKKRIWDEYKTFLPFNPSKKMWLGSSFTVSSMVFESYKNSNRSSPKKQFNKFAKIYTMIFLFKNQRYKWVIWEKEIIRLVIEFRKTIKNILLDHLVHPTFAVCCRWYLSQLIWNAHIFCKVNMPQPYPRILV